MAARNGWLMGLLLAVVGCHAFMPAKAEPLAAPEPALTATAPAFVVRPVESAPRPEPARSEIIHPTRIALASATEPAGPNHLSLAAAQLEKGDEAGACAHLAIYLAAHPEHTVVRVHFAELLLRQDHADAACWPGGRVQSRAQIGQRIRCESRLAKMAETREDLYEEHLHRGIGLYLLAMERLGQPDDRHELRVEALLFKAASELTQARSIDPGEARPNWYLHEVWSRLGQRQAALRRLKVAETAADLPTSPRRAPRPATRPTAHAKSALFRAIAELVGAARPSGTEPPFKELRSGSARRTYFSSATGS